MAFRSASDSAKSPNGDGASAVHTSPVNDLHLQELRNEYLQQTLINLLPATVMSEPSKDQAQAKAQIEKRRHAILREAQARQFGPATEKAYSDFSAASSAGSVRAARSVSR
jgi:hypothetical protein